MSRRAARHARSIEKANVVLFSSGCSADGFSWCATSNTRSRRSRSSGSGVRTYQSAIAYNMSARITDELLDECHAYCRATTPPAIPPAQLLPARSVCTRKKSTSRFNVLKVPVYGTEQQDKYSVFALPVKAPRKESFHMIVRVRLKSCQSMGVG